jgi:sugar/nucleoside kinase (ribokinase family)
MISPRRPCPPLVVVGALGYDEVTTAEGDRFHDLGGSAAYAAVAAAFTAEVVLLSRVGRDFREKDRQLLRDRGVRLDHLEQDFAKASFRWAAVYRDGGETRETTGLEPGAFADFRCRWPGGLQAGAVQMGSIAPPMQRRLLETIPQGLPFAFDSFPHWIEAFPEEVDRLLRRAAFITLNEEEVRLLAGKEDAREGARFLFRKYHPTAVILKRGRRGIHLVGRDAEFSLPALRVQRPVETTGAGDSFAGAFLAKWLEEPVSGPERLRVAAAYASAVAAATVSGTGIQGLLNADPSTFSRPIDGLR